MKTIKMIYSDYNATFLVADSSNHWEELGTVGNTGVAMDFAEMLRKLGHTVEMAEMTVEQEND